ncbi:MAG TPA: carboxypeptidase regulatory-like domain-containing protein [Armatimonadota bacterium]
MRMKPPVGRAVATAMALGLSLLALSASAQTIRVEGENYLAPPDSGPNQSDVVSVFNPAPGVSDIEFFVCWDYVEWDVNVPQDGTYDVSYRFASDWGKGAAGDIFQTLTFWTSSQQVVVNDLTKTSGWGDFQVKPVAAGIPLKAGMNRFRIKITPDNGDANFFGSGMNLDYIELTRTGDYPNNFEAVTGVVTAPVDGTPTPLRGAYVSVGSDYTQAQYLTRTDSAGHYTLYLPHGEHNLTAFYNGYDKASATVTGVGSHDFALTYSGKYEAELFQITNPGPGDSEGFQPAFNTSRSGSGVMWRQDGDDRAGKYAEWPNVVAPTAGVYEFSMNYAGFKVSAQPGYGRYAWSANGGTPVELRYASTGADAVSATYKDSGKVLIPLLAGVNNLRLDDPDGVSKAFVDTFTLAPATQPYGWIKVKVVQGDVAKTPIPGASVSIDTVDTTAAGFGYSAASDANGEVLVPAPLGAYTVVASTATAAQSASGNVNVAAAGVTYPLELTLTLTASAVEAEDFVAAGPAVPGASEVNINGNLAASGGKDVTGFGAVDRREWLEWDVPAAEDGLYELTVRYKVESPPTKAILTVWNTTFQAPEADLTYAPAYDDWVATSTAPLKAGLNRVRMTMTAGSVSVDYIKYQRKGALPALGTITGKISGTDGTGVAAVGNAMVYTGGDANSADHITMTDALGNYTLTLPAGANTISASSPGYVPSSGDGGSTGGAVNITLNTNLTNGLQVEAESAPSMSSGLAAKEDLEDPQLQTVITNSGPGAWFDLPVSAPRSGVYQVGMRYASGWNPTDGLPIKTNWTLNGTDFHLNFPTTTAWTDFQILNNAGTILLNAGLNALRINYVDKGSKFDYFTLTRTGALPALSSDIDGNGITDIIDAVIYVRRLSGLDTGVKNDVDGNGVTDMQDVQRILNIAGGRL